MAKPDPAVVCQLAFRDGKMRNHCHVMMELIVAGWSREEFPHFNGKLQENGTRGSCSRALCRAKLSSATVDSVTGETAPVFPTES